MKLPVDKTAGCAAAVRINANQKTGNIRVRFIMGKRPAFQIGFQALMTLGALHGIEALRQGAGRRIAAQCQSSVPLKKRLDGSAKPSPILDLPGNRAFYQLACYAGVQNERIRELYWLAHIHMVA